MSLRSIASWVISRSWTQCGQPQTTWPSAAASAGPRPRGLGSTMTSHSVEQLLAGAQAGDQARRAASSGDAEALSVAAFEVHPCSQFGVDALEMVGVQGQSPFVGLAGGGHDSEAQGLHAAESTERSCPLDGRRPARLGVQRGSCLSAVAKKSCGEVGLVSDGHRSVTEDCDVGTSTPAGERRRT